METKKIRFFHIFMCAIFLFMLVPPINMFASTNEAQQGAISVKGIVKDKEGETLPGVSISVKGTTIGVMTDIDGAYTINVPDRNAVLVVTYVGYKQQELKLDGKTNIDVVLEESTQLLEEIVVVGYGVQKKANLTGSVSSISSKELNSRPLTNVSSALGGLAAGVSVTQVSGSPTDDGAKIRVRGTGTLNNSDALIVVDGIVVETMDAVNPQDIESISVLKDAASSSIYGSRAANGVILITTKMGTKGKSVISFNTTLSIAKPSKRFDFVSDYPRYMKLMNESAENIGRTQALFPDSDIEMWEYAKQNPNELNEFGYPLSVVYPNTDWGKEAFETKLIQNYNLSASGGTDKVTYNLSLGYLKNPGIMVNSGIERYQARANVEAKLMSFLTVGTQTFFSTQRNNVGDLKDGFNFLRQTTPGYIAKPYDGKFQSPSSSYESQMANSIYDRLTRRAGADRYNRMNTTWYARFDLMKELTFETKVNYQRMNRERNYYNVSRDRWNFATGQITFPAASPKDNETTYGYLKEYTLTLDNVLRYNKTFAKDHDLGLLLGHNEYYFNHNEYSAVKKGLIDQDLHNFDNANSVLKATGSEWDNSMRSFFGRVNYAYKSKYLFEANIRRDGSSRFSKDNRWGNFPSFSAGWRLSEEDFIGDGFRNTFQNFKLRTSWGKLGNSVTTMNGTEKFYAFMNSYTNLASSSTNNNGTYYSFNGDQVTGLVVKDLGNNDLKWETTRVIDFALEATTFGGRASFELDFYDRYTDGILFVPTLPAVLGWKNAPIMNLAEVSNKGFEFTANWRDNIGDLTYSVGANLSYNKNKVEKYNGAFSQGWITDAAGNRVWQSNFSQVASEVKLKENPNAFDDQGFKGYIVEGHEIGEFYVKKLYNGNGSYFNSDGKVNPKGGPKDGMIRTKEDMDWVKAMQAAGYKFSPNNNVAKGGLYYGDYIYADLNEDGVYGDSFDRDFVKASTMPKWGLGINLSAAYKGFDFSMLWSGNFGGKIWSNVIAVNSSQTVMGNNIPSMVADDHYFYNPDDPSDARTNINGKYARLRYDTNEINSERSEVWIYSTSYFRMKNIQLGYTLPKRITSKIGSSLVRFFVSGENLLTITSFDGLDPETQGMSTYPSLKQVAFGLTVNF